MTDLPGFLSGVELIESLTEVIDQILNILASGGNADQVVVGALGEH